MTNVEILQQLRELPLADRLQVIESSVHQIRVDLEKGEADGPSMEDRLKHAASALLHDYSKDRELVALTAIDGDKFHA